MPLLHARRALCPHHAGEVEGRDVRPPVGVLGKLQLPQLSTGSEVRSSPGKVLQSLWHHVGAAQQLVGLRPVLQDHRLEPAGPLGSALASRRCTSRDPEEGLPQTTQPLQVGLGLQPDPSASRLQPLFGTHKTASSLGPAVPKAV